MERRKWTTARLVMCGLALGYGMGSEARSQEPTAISDYETAADCWAILEFNPEAKVDALLDNIAAKRRLKDLAIVFGADRNLSEAQVAADLNDRADEYEDAFDEDLSKLSAKYQTCLARGKAR